jgi:SAM-dependent methyltransferase
MPIPKLQDIVKIQTENKASPVVFRTSGVRTAALFLEELAEYGVAANSLRSVLEFGVGYARILRWFSVLPAELAGCDVTRDVITWCKKELSEVAAFEQTGFSPPLPYKDGQFDFIYANSVFTHIRHEQVPAWVTELRRVIKPGGIIITTQYDANEHLRHLKPREIDAAYERFGFVEWGNETVRENNISYSAPALKRIWGKDFKVVDLRQHLFEQSHLICLAR